MSKIFFISMFVVLAACAALPASTPTPEPAATPTSPSKAACSPPSAWTIEYHRTGGFGGFDQSLTVQSGGSLAIQSKQPPVDKQMTLPEDHMQAITDLLVQACPFEVGSKPGVCADCFNYELKIQMDGKTYTVKALDTNLPEELRPLTNALDEFLQLSGQ